MTYVHQDEEEVKKKRLSTQLYFARFFEVPNKSYGLLRAENPGCAVEET